MARSLLVKSHLPLQSLEVGDELVGDPHCIISVTWIPLIPNCHSPNLRSWPKKKKGEEKPEKYTTEEGWFSPKEVNIPTLKLPRKKSALRQEMKSPGWDFNSGKEISFLFLVFRATETRTTY